MGPVLLLAASQAFPIFLSSSFKKWSHGQLSQPTDLPEKKGVSLSLFSTPLFLPLDAKVHFLFQTPVTTRPFLHAALNH